MQVQGNRDGRRGGVIDLSCFQELLYLIIQALFNGCDQDIYPSRAYHSGLFQDQPIEKVIMVLTSRF